MRRLGEILLERGYASVGELHTALEASHRHKGRLGTQLLRLGFVTEKQLLEALAEQTGCPLLPREVLRSTSAEVRKLVPPEDLRRLQAVPFAIHHGRLQVAMTNPRDRAAIEEIQNLTEMLIETYVGTESSIGAAIHAIASENRTKKAVSTTAPPPVKESRSLAPDTGWDKLWKGEMPSADQLLRPLEEWSGHLETSIRYASYPSLAPVVDPDSVQGSGYLDEEEFERALIESETRDDVGRALLSYAARFLTRLCLFSVFKEQVHGWLAHGMGPVLEDLQAYSLPLERPSIFGVLSKTATHLQGKMPPGQNNMGILQCLGEAPGEDVVLIPFQVKGRIVGFVLGDIPGQGTIGVPVQDIQTAATAAGIALEMMILKRKISRSLQR